MPIPGADSNSSERFLHLLDSVKVQYQQDVWALKQEVARLQGTSPLKALEHPGTNGWGNQATSDAVRCSQAPGWERASSSRVSQADLGVCSIASARPLRSKENESLRLRSQWTSSGRLGNDGAAADNMQAVDYEESKQLEEAHQGLLPMLDNDSLWARYVLNPNTAWRTYWALAGLGMVFFDMVNVPLQAFELPDLLLFDFMDWAAMLFWTADMANSFFCGYYDNGEIVVTWRKIVFRYLRTWFIVDLVVIGPDWFQKLILGGSDKKVSGSLGRLLRGARAIRILRLLRIMKLQRIMIQLYDMIDNEYSFILAELIKMMFCILIVNHFIACAWFWIGDYTSSMGWQSWTTWAEQFKELGIGYQYTTAMHWTLTQFTPASMDVVARNILERLYSIFVLLFAMVAFSSIVGTVTTSMTVIRQMKDDKQKQFWKLRRYLKQQNVSSDLTQRMLRFIEYQCSKQEKAIQTGSVVLLQRLSEQLSSEFSHELHSPFMLGHCFYRMLSKDMKGIAFRVCHLAIKAQQIATYDLLFAAGEEADTAFILKSGGLRYVPHNGEHLVPPPQEKEWLAEAVLWTPWRFRGSCRGASPSEILALNAKSFAQALSNHPKSFDFARRYAERFLRYLNLGNPTEWTDILRDEEFYNLAVADGPGCEEWLDELEEEGCNEPDGGGVSEEAVDTEEKNEVDDDKEIPCVIGEGSEEDTEAVPNGIQDTALPSRAQNPTTGPRRNLVFQTSNQTSKSWVSTSFVGPCFTSCVPGRP